MKKILCENKECNFRDEFEPEEFGLNYFQAVGLCPECGSKVIYEDGTPTRIVVEFIAK